MYCKFGFNKNMIPIFFVVLATESNFYFQIKTKVRSNESNAIKDLLVMFFRAAIACGIWNHGCLDLQIYRFLKVYLTDTYLLSRYLLRLFDCLAHPNLGATFATDQKWPICHLRISYQSLAGGLKSLKKSEFLKLIILIFHVKKLNN